MRTKIFLCALVAIVALSSCKKDKIEPFTPENANYAESVVFEPSTITLSDYNWVDVEASSVPEDKNYYLEVASASPLQLRVSSLKAGHDLLIGTRFIQRGVSPFWVSADKLTPGTYEVIARNNKDVLGRLTVIIQ